MEIAFKASQLFYPILLLPLKLGEGIAHGLYLLFSNERLRHSQLRLLKAISFTLFCIHFFVFNLFYYLCRLSKGKNE